MKRLEEVGDDDFSFSLAAVGRFRCSAYRQRGSYGAVLRAVPFSIPDAEKLHIPKAVMDLFSPQARHGAGHGPGRQRQVHDPGLPD